MQLFLKSVGFGLVTASVIAIAPVGLTLQFGITNVINFAYGDYLTVAAYMGYIANGPLHQNIVASLFVAAVVTGVFAVLANEFVIQPFLRGKPRLVIMLIVTVGISLIMENTLQIIFRPGFYTYTGLPSASLTTIGPLIFSGTQLVIMAIVVVVLALEHADFAYVLVDGRNAAYDRADKLADRSDVEGLFVG